MSDSSRLIKKFVDEVRPLIEDYYAYAAKTGKSSFYFGRCEELIGDATGAKFIAFGCFDPGADQQTKFIAELLQVSGIDTILAKRKREEYDPHQSIAIDHNSLSNTSIDSFKTVLFIAVESERALFEKKLSGQNLADILGKDSDTLWRILLRAGEQSESALAAVIRGTAGRLIDSEQTADDQRTPENRMIDLLRNALSKTMPGLSREIGNLALKAGREPKA